MVTQKVGVIDLTPCGKLELRGRDAARLLDRLTANDLPAIGRTVTTHMLTETGRVYAELTLTQLEDNSFFCITDAASELRDLRYSQMSVPSAVMMRPSARLLPAVSSVDSKLDHLHTSLGFIREMRVGVSNVQRR